MDDREVPHYFICPISLQIMKDPVTVATGITYDRESIQRWQLYRKNKTCPVTNQPLPFSSDFIPNHNLRRLIQAWCVSDQVPIVVSCYQNGTIVGVKEALNVLYLVGFTQDETSSLILAEHDRIINSLTWVLGFSDTTMKFHAMVLLKDIINNAKSHVLERLKPDFFETILRSFQQLDNKNLEQGIIKEGLHVLLRTCSWPRNCSMMIQALAVFELVELEIGSPEKATTELIMAVLFHLCCSADGRAQLLGHGAGIALITKRMGMVSQKVDERALMIISLISKFSATDGVLQEMVRVGTVEKLCMVLQVNDRHSHARDKAREILKRHSNVWKDSPCLDLSLLTRYPR